MANMRFHGVFKPRMSGSSRAIPPMPETTGVTISGRSIQKRPHAGLGWSTPEIMRAMNPSPTMKPMRALSNMERFLGLCRRNGMVQRKACGGRTGMRFIMLY
jgi:hypothetical protein